MNNIILNILFKMNNKSSFGINFLKKIRLEKGYSLYKLAKDSNTTPTQVKQLEEGRRKLTLEWAKRFSNILHCTPADIIGYENLGITKNNTDSIKIKLYTQEFSCGCGEELFNYEEYSNIPISEKLLNKLRLSNSVIAVIAHGNSMEPVIKNKDIVFIDKLKVEIIFNKSPNKNVYAFRYNNCLHIKFLKLNKEQSIITAFSFNPENEPFIISLKEHPDFEIIGKVVGVYNNIDQN